MRSDIKNAVIISITNDFSEIKQLAKTLGYKTVKTFYQKREKPDVNNFIGSGKVEEIKEFMENCDQKIHILIVDSDLKPSQWFNLEKTLKIDVYDRIRLILAIFEQRAERKEAKLQVKLAQLQYERPFVRELIHRARAGEHPGFMAGGEYQVDDYYEMIKKQMKKIRNDLRGIRDEREIRRRHRFKSGFCLVSLAGYTNAGKSSLLNLLSDEKVKVEGQLFSTLSTTTRRAKKKNMPILITDTVGFIQNLPAFVIDAFHSTLEEIQTADLVLLVVDISEEKNTVLKKLNVSLEELADIGVETDVIIVLNKSDLISEEELMEKTNFLKQKGALKDKFISVSVKQNKNIDRLLDMICYNLPDIISFKIELPVTDDAQRLVSWIHDRAFVEEIVYNDHITLFLKSNSEIYHKILSKSKKIMSYTIN